MDTEELVRRWKQPGARRGEAVDHPSGEITLRSGGALARRVGLLAELAGLHDDGGGTTWTSMSWSAAPEPELGC